ncbi:glycosyltransferase [Vicingaceae bacterium]|nr:glycosyltransferase [Vicingaceae bacterium]MDB4060477.1 glycosyltransferase [Vicingaceae bacterium]
MKVSIITVCYNSATTIEDTIQSVLGQTYDAIEYIIIDGASSDETLQIMDKYKNDISVLVSEKDKGMYDAINKGIQLSTGDIIGILNSDDFYIDNSVISEVVQQMQREKADSLYSDLYYVATEDTNKVVRNWVSGKYNRQKFLCGWMPPHPTFFVKRKAYEKYGNFNLDLKSAADYELMLRFLHKNNISTCYLPRPLVRMRVGGMSNVSLINRIKANKEDRKAWRMNGLQPRPYTMLLKPLRKVLQYVRK